MAQPRASIRTGLGVGVRGAEVYRVFRESKNRDWGEEQMRGTQTNFTERPTLPH